MYTFLITESNELLASVRERIMQRSKLVDKLHFLTAPIYKGEDMSKYTVLMEYITPVSKQYKSEFLTLSNELYKDNLEYTLPLDTELTGEPGQLEIQITFSYVEMDEYGKTIQHIRKISPGELTIVPIAAWSDMIPDAALSALDQRLLALQARQEQLEDLQNTYMEEKADDLSYENNVLQLVSNGKKIGSKHTISPSGSGEGVTGEFDVIEFSDKERIKQGHKTFAPKTNNNDDFTTVYF